MARLGLDIDGPSYEFVGSFQKTVSKQTGRPIEDLPYADNWNFFNTQWGYTVEEYLHFMRQGVFDGDLFWRGDITEGCLNAVIELYEAGNEIVFITARAIEGIEEECKLATIFWLDDVGLPYDELIIANDKREHKFDVLLDDSPKNVQRAIETDQRVVVFDRPWNREVEGADRVHSWPEFVQYVKKNLN